MAIVELSQLNLKYEVCRLRDTIRERFLLWLIREQGIREPLLGVFTADGRQLILLDGFKRYRCARSLGHSTVPCVGLGEDEADGIVHLLRLSNAHSLNIVEQAKLVDELKTNHNLGVTEMAQRLERSKAWVSVRLGILQEMSVVVQDKIFQGKFPVRCYMYTLQQFTRVNKMTPAEVDEFVQAVAGKGLSCRQIDLLAKGFVEGSELLRQQIRERKFTLVLHQMQHLEPAPNDNLSEPARRIIHDLQIVHQYINRILRRPATNFTEGAFWAEAGLLAGGILSGLPEFHKILEGWDDSTRKTSGHLSAAPGRPAEERNSQVAAG